MLAVMLAVWRYRGVWNPAACLSPAKAAAGIAAFVQGSSLKLSVLAPMRGPHMRSRVCPRPRTRSAGVRRYEIKFRVDGEWRVAPEWPTVGHGMTENNVLVVD